MSVIDTINHERRALYDATQGFSAFKPPTRMRVTEAATQYLKLYQPGGGATPWDANETPYMVEPTDIFASRQHEASIFVGPARTAFVQVLHGLIDILRKGIRSHKR